MNTDDSRFGNKIRHLLDEGTDRLDGKVLNRLHEARQLALSRQKVSVWKISLAGNEHSVSFHFPVVARALVAAFALLLGVAFTYYWNSSEQAAENAAIDSALLSDELPPAAYLDKGFQAWLERSTLSSR